LTQAQQKLASVQDLVSGEHARALSLQQEIEALKIAKENSEELEAEVERLRGFEDEVEQYRRLNVNPKDWETFAASKGAIRHYLKLVPMLIE